MTLATTVNRRSFLAGSAAVAVSPALGAVPASGEVDIAIIGAGAAGIAAARRVAAAKQRFALIEAAERVGGRCITESRTFGVPFDRGAHWIHAPDINPVAKLATGSGFELYPAPPGHKIRIGRRHGRESEMEDFLAALVRASRAIAEAARGKADVSCALALPKDMGEWGPTVEFVLGPFGCGKDLAEVSAVDFARSVERTIDAYFRAGYGAALARLAAELPVQVSSPVTRVSWTGRTGVDIETPRGRIRARAAIVTVSTAILAAGKIRFIPDLPRRQQEAAAKLSLGSYDHIALELPNNPLGLQADDLVFEKSHTTRTGAILANMSGSTLCMVEVAGKFGRDLAAQGEQAMIAFALEWLGGLYGADLTKKVRRAAATRWNEEPWVLGAFSAAMVGGQPARRALMEPLNNRLWFAGEAVHETLWGTVGGAWESGERAAVDALRRIGAIAEPAAARERPRRRRTR